MRLVICELLQNTTSSSSPRRKGQHGQPADNSLDKLEKSVFHQELGLTMSKTTSYTENIELESGRGFISLFRHQGFRACNQNDYSDMFGAGRCIIILSAH